ncbi:hypothetical protein SAMN02745157_0698 [Kaistia soli DSM 19436]|uniref:Phage tail tube protein n=1 Tax=Kaistia soli DSM 19436 TaxID=1122133 RepID=A0A1M4VGF6_9HYPH|nr:hypothetical protein [Kaistia soli]SHE68051.1 hypothetical protein SAMN02745157_0698 [Kaistia soli DSM 19436]
MGVHIGNEGQVKIGANVIAEVTGFQITENAAVADTSTLSTAWDTHLAGSKSWSAQIDCWWDETDADGQGALEVGSTVSLLNLYCAGSSVGDTYFTGDGTVTQITRQVARNQTQTASFQVQGNGQLAKATVLA